jgi:sRNA-binding carbon storage regulator CsrA
MGLKLTVSRGDKIIIGDSIIAEVRTTSDKQTQIEFNAPQDVKIYAIFKDINKQFKNRE